MGEYGVFTDEMEYPEGMTDEQVCTIVRAFEMRRFAYEFEWQLECEEGVWVDDAKRLIESGEVTARELVEEAFRRFRNEETVDFHRYFSNAVEDFV